MIRGTTPSLTLTISGTGVNLSSANNVYVTLSNGLHTITKTGSDLAISATQVICYLTQAESLTFSEGRDVLVQVNWTYTDGGATKRAATITQAIEVTKQLLPEVIS